MIFETNPRISLEIRFPTGSDSSDSSEVSDSCDGSDSCNSCDRSDSSDSSDNSDKLNFPKKLFQLNCLTKINHTKNFTQKITKNSKTSIVMKLNNSNCDET